MTTTAPRSIQEYLRQLRAALEGEDPALIQDALYDAEEYLRAEVAAHPTQSESDTLELIATSYGAPDEVAAAYRDTETKVKAALLPTPPRHLDAGPLRRFFGIYLDPRAYTSLFFMLLALVTGTVYFSFAMIGLSVSLGLSILIVGVPVFLAFIGVSRVIALGEGRLIEAISGERMPRRPVHPGPAAGWLARIGDMLADLRTWTTLAYLLVMLPIGIVYFIIATVGLSVGLAFIAVAPLAVMHAFGWTHHGHILLSSTHWHGLFPTLDSTLGLSATAVILFVTGILIITLLLHVARGIGRLHAHIAKALLVKLAA